VPSSCLLPSLRFANISQSPARVSQELDIEGEHHDPQWVPEILYIQMRPLVLPRKPEIYMMYRVHAEVQECRKV
jgi:hypothetical protein